MKDTITLSIQSLIVWRWSDLVKYLPNYIKSRVDKNQNFVMLFVGQTGTGKSYAAMSLGEEVDPGFGIERVVFSADEFISSLNSDESLVKGSVIMWDEAGVGMPAREWYSLSNKVISYVVQTFRVKGYILIMTTPSLKYIDSQIRSLFHGIAETIDPSMYGGNFGWAKYMHLTHDPKEGKTIMQYPVIMDEHNRAMKIKGRTARHGNMLFPKPSEELISDYEAKKKEFTDGLIASASDMMIGKEEGEESGVSIGKLKQMVVADPTKWGMMYMGSKRQFETHVYAILKTEYPEWEVRMTDIRASIHLIEHDINTGVLKIEEGDPEDMEVNEGVVTLAEIPIEKKGGREPAFKESDVSRVMESIEEHGFNESARKLEVSKSTLYTFRKKMKEIGKWPDGKGAGA